MAKKFWKFLAILLLLALVGAAAYILHLKHISSLVQDRSKLQQEVSTLQSQLSDANKTPETPASVTAKGAVASQSNYAVLTGQAGNVTHQGASVEALYLSGEVDEVWVEYGTKPDVLTTSTQHDNQEMGLGVGDIYVAKSFEVKNLKSGTKYFYRAAAKANDQTIYGGVSAFTTSK